QNSNDFKEQKMCIKGRATPWGNNPPKTMRPVRAKALIINAFALTGRSAFIYPYTQGGALGYVLTGLSARIIQNSYKRHSLLQLDFFQNRCVTLAFG
ncbi:hypothetical protein, partial [Prevotella sp.]|uniref:hypothetical protein n=1 Tax=Prevotella sp. TaxID=59823 RepID=UPI003F7D61B5